MRAAELDAGRSNETATKGLWRQVQAEVPSEAAPKGALKWPGSVLHDPCSLPFGDGEGFCFPVFKPLIVGIPRVPCIPRTASGLIESGCPTLHRQCSPCYVSAASMLSVGSFPSVRGATQHSGRFGSMRPSHRLNGLLQVFGGNPLVTPWESFLSSLSSES